MNTRLSSTAALAALMWGATPGCGYLDDVSTGAEHVGYAPDGTLAVFTPAGITLYDAEMKNVKTSIRLAAQAGTVDVPVTFDLAGDGTSAVVGYSNTVKKDVAIYAIPQGRVTTTIDVDMPPFADGIPVQRVTISPAGDLVYVRAPHSGMFRAADGAALWGEDSQELGLEPMTFSADGATVFGVHYYEGPSRVALEAHDALTGALLYSVDTGRSVAALTLAADGATLVVVEDDPCPADPSPSCESYSIVFRSTADGAVVRSVPYPAGLTIQRPGLGTALTCSSAGNLCATGALDEGREPIVILFDADGAVIRRLSVTFAIEVAFSPDGALLAVAGGDARVFRVGDGTLVSRRTYTYGVF
jgi:hypothetical protein